MHILAHVTFAKVQSCISNLKTYQEQLFCNGTLTIFTLRTLEKIWGMDLL